MMQRNAGLRPGEVALVGAGPGDVELLTLKALRLLQQADAVVYDRLVGEEILALIPARAQRHDVGKGCGVKSLSQEAIGELLISLALQGKRVVRLKGGDPYVFGRGGEEALALQARGIRFVVVPGITAALGCAASCGIPLTHRGISRSVTLVTGHLQAEAQQSEQLFHGWQALVSGGHTLVFYMGLEQADHIQQGLLSAGADGSLPVALIIAGTMRHQQVVISSLSDLAQQAERLKGQTPVLILVGEVVRLRDQLTQIGETLLSQVA
jgi:uroporphyrin-III C-methyltransferase